MTKKSVWSVLAGLLFILVATTAVDLALHAAGVYPPQGQPLSDSLVSPETESQGGLSTPSHGPMSRGTSELKRWLFVATIPTCRPGTSRSDQPSKGGET